MELKFLLNLVILILTFVFILSCSTITLPTQEYVLARSAMESAQEFDAERLAPVIFQEAQDYYKRAERFYNEKEFEQARINFINARKSAEKAETTSRIKKAKTGEVL